MKRILSFLLSLFVLFIVACNDDDDLQIEIKNEYQTTASKVLTITPDIEEGSDMSYKWTMIQNPMNDVTDSVLSTNRDLEFIAIYSGVYELNFEASSGSKTGSQTITVNVSEEEEQYCPYVTSMYDFEPAPGTMANDCYKEDGYTREDVMNIALGRIDSTSVGYLLDLGSFGGTVVVGFDHTIMNVPGEKDFRVYGENEVIATEPVAPGLLFVAYDQNGNGKPDDDEWYEIKGSSHDTDDMTDNFSITYHRRTEGTEVPSGRSFKDIENVYCEPGTGDSYYLVLLKGYEDLCPLWLDQDKFSYSGKRLDVHVEASSPGQYTLWSYDVPEWGYANALDPDIDIDWAVDQDGNEVHLPGIDFLKVVNCVSTDDIMIYSSIQTSMTTKIAGAGDLHLIEKYNL
jgi:hypothetical protein